MIQGQLSLRLLINLNLETTVMFSFSKVTIRLEEALSFQFPPTDACASEHCCYHKTGHRKPDFSPCFPGGQQFFSTEMIGTISPFIRENEQATGKMQFFSSRPPELPFVRSHRR
jgi:hypothetical protein